ncbi:MAG: hypothetical protein IT423_01020 [Pirellulaceae bacterium]|nr:hypothetical protein [Pirellulaceae bacterium]
MSSTNRGDRIQLLQKVLKKHYKPAPISEARSVLDHLLFACLVEDAPFDAAEEIFQRLPDLFVDWNEVRVTTVTELADSLRNLPDPTAAAARLKRTLQALFETRYSFDLEEMRKMNQGKAIQELAKFNGVSRFMLAYVTQHAFAGHTIPISDSIMQVLLMTGIVTQSEAEKHQTPGLERAIPKSKGHEFSSCLHQMAVEYRTNSNKNIKAILKEAGGIELKPEPKPAPTPPKSAIAAKPKKAEPVKPTGKETKETKETKESKEVKAVAASKPRKDDKPNKEAKDTKKPTVTKKSLPPKKATKVKGTAEAAAKKPVVKKITNRKPK